MSLRTSSRHLLWLCFYLSGTFCECHGMFSRLYWYFHVEYSRSRLKLVSKVFNSWCENQILISWFRKQVSCVFSKKVSPLLIVVQKLNVALLQVGKHDSNLSDILLVYLQTRKVYFNSCRVINYWRRWLDSRDNGVWERDTMKVVIF